jgi:hypothetical protein
MKKLICFIIGVPYTPLFFKFQRYINKMRQKNGEYALEIHITGSSERMAMESGSTEIVSSTPRKFLDELNAISEKYGPATHFMNCLKIAFGQEDTGAGHMRIQSKEDAPDFLQELMKASLGGK